MYTTSTPQTTVFHSKRHWMASTKSTSPALSAALACPTSPPPTSKRSYVSPRKRATFSLQCSKEATTQCSDLSRRISCQCFESTVLPSMRTARLQADFWPRHRNNSKMAVARGGGPGPIPWATCIIACTRISRPFWRRSGHGMRLRLRRASLASRWRIEYGHLTPPPPTQRRSCHVQ